MKRWISNIFDLKANGTTIRIELIAGLTTFLTMAYIVFVNPGIQKAAGMPFGAVMVGTCLAIPLTFSISNGLALGFIMYPTIKILTGRWREANWLMYVLAILFILKFIFLRTE